MTSGKRPDAAPAAGANKANDTLREHDEQQAPLVGARDDKKKPKPDGEAIAELGDEVGGPA
jgi:hypothetical protein